MQTLTTIAIEGEELSEEELRMATGGGGNGKVTMKPTYIEIPDPGKGEPGSRCETDRSNSDDIVVA